MPLHDPASPVLKAYFCYLRLIREANSSHSADPSLRGKLLYAGELDDVGRALVIAGNVAGCATLAATAHADAQKPAIRDGIADFLVTTLDEALRILKNEIRKHGTVAVCVGRSPVDVEREMIDRGVQPDLTREHSAHIPSAIAEDLLKMNADPIRSPATVFWQIESSPARWLPKLDAIALECLDSEDHWNRRWIRLSSRYLGRIAPGDRMLCADRDFAARFVEYARAAFDRGDIATSASIVVTSNAGSQQYRFGAMARQ